MGHPRHPAGVYPVHEGHQHAVPGQPHCGRGCGALATAQENCPKNAALRGDQALHVSTPSFSSHMALQGPLESGV